MGNNICGGCDATYIFVTSKQIYLLSKHYKTMKTNQFFNQVRQMLLAIVCLAVFAPLASCVNDDEPTASVEYYLQVESRNKLESVNGISPSSKDDMLGHLTSEMREKIHDVYPVPDPVGADVQVLVACDEVYQRYLTMDLKSDCDCVAVLCRVKKEGGIVRQTVNLKTYRL